MPFKNRGHTFDELLNQGGVMAGKYTLLDFLRQDKFQIVVGATSSAVETTWHINRLPPPFAYPYGNIHNWDTGRYANMLNQNKGPQFAPSWSYHDDNTHLTVMTQSEAQDFMWLDKAAGELASRKVSAYFVERNQGNTSRYYAIITLSKRLQFRYKHALCRLTNAGSFKLALYDNCADKVNSGEWDAKIVDHSQDIDVLNAHPITELDLILDVRRPLPMQAARGSEFAVITFSDRSIADNCAALRFDVHAEDYERKVDAVCAFQPGEQPTNSTGGMGRDDVDFKMSLHRDLVRGTGFCDTLLGEVPSVEDPSLQSLSSPARSLPVVNLLGTDEDYSKALMQEALPDDGARLHTYLSERPLGLGIITAGAGLGKTTALAIGTIGMAYSLGKIYATGSTDAVVDNFATRLDCVDTGVTDRMNESKKDDDETRVQYKHVVRGYKIDDEASAFLHLLRFPDDGDKAAPSSFLSGQSEWKMHLSAAYWLLVLLRFPKVRELSLDDSTALHEMRNQIDNDGQLERLRALAAQGIDWHEYEQGAMISKHRLDSLLEEIVRIADIVCTTPSLSAKKPYSTWKRCEAQGIAVDEAACMSRPDLYCVWGNTLLPCLMAGDNKQFPPMVATLQAMDDKGNYYNRFGQHAKISPLVFFMAMGWPTYRLGLLE
ncbi:hypothetical protein NCS56_00625300 [Fusarium sp. Ph1]|nr:hypothetical protein NCS56_00625300 [Fusarium sp. Ph1]